MPWSPDFVAAGGDTDAAADSFAPNGYLRDPLGQSHRGPDELPSFFAAGLRDDGIRLDFCQTTDDGVRRAAECICVRWGSHTLVAARFYDDVEVLNVP
jgi:hypothetical protein